MSDYDTENEMPDSDDLNQDEESATFVPSRPGRMVSASGLVERVVEQFMIEHGESESDAVREATSDTQRRGLVRDVAQYVFGVEAVQLTLSEQARIIAQAYSAIFGYGALDSLFADEQIVTITLEGIQRIAVRYGPGDELIPLDPVFESIPEMRGIVRRLLRHAGVEIQGDYSIVEAGLLVNGRRVCVTAAFPPYVSELAADIRIHPRETITLDDLVRSGFLTDEARVLIDAIADSGHGIVVVGDTESGKTTLLGSLIQRMQSPESIVLVERAGELGVNEQIQRFVPKWAQETAENRTFGEQILAALAMKPQLLVLDEVRADEPETISPLLREPDIPRQIWSFRGSSEPHRIRSSLNMLARMADANQPEAMVYQLYQRLPFVLIVKRRKGALYLREIAEWQFPVQQAEDQFQYAEYVPLLSMQSDGLLRTGNMPARALNLPDDFWK
jgi:type IV secretory pathway ATPase VirB11/archaellum biosynthesis ATPase